MYIKYMSKLNEKITYPFSKALLHSVTVEEPSLANDVIYSNNTLSQSPNKG